MTNLLTLPAQWDDGVASPPAAWNGTAYVLSFDEEVAGSLNWSFQGGMTTSDSVTGSIAFANAADSAAYLALMDGDLSEVYAYTELVAGETTSFSLVPTLTILDPRLAIVTALDAGEAGEYLGLSVTMVATAIEAVPYITRGTHRAYMETDSAQLAWVRTDSGKYDMTGATLTVEIHGEGKHKPRLTIDATSPEVGKLAFTVTANGARTRLWPGTFRLFAKADGRVIYTGLLEVLA